MKRRYWSPGFGSPEVEEPVSGSSSAGVPIAKVPILALSGQCGGALGAEVGLGVGAGALAVGGVGVDREALRAG